MPPGTRDPGGPGICTGTGTGTGTGTDSPACGRTAADAGRLTPAGPQVQRPAQVRRSGIPPRQRRQRRSEEPTGSDGSCSPRPPGSGRSMIMRETTKVAGIAAAAAISGAYRSSNSSTSTSR